MAEDEIWVDPDMRQAMARSAEIAREYGLAADRSTLTPEQARERMELDRRWWNQERPEMARIVDTTVAGPQRDIPVRLLYPREGENLPVIVYLHGGGWVVGSLETHARSMHLLALASGCVVAAVDYALAPETKFPGAIEETVAVIDFVAASGADWSLDPSRIALGGDSAGANLAVGAELALRSRGVSPVKALGLVYGVFGDDFETPSYRTFGGGAWGLTTADMKAYFAHYLGTEADRDDPRAVPMKADVSGFPPCFLHAAGVDVLRDDSRLFYEKLRGAGVPVEHTEHAGIIHGSMGQTRMVAKARDLISCLGRQLAGALGGEER
ncbi:alpha/beta hydrolase fold domain-containing protein [Thalassobaculum sp.]|uniref:alpha/beta hydrolase fold domain-containing protein n=1 Tax=Thalassobaculum sp. TaxID=2022740 RepID=UPI0032EBC237